MHEILNLIEQELEAIDRLASSETDSGSADVAADVPEPEQPTTSDDELSDDETVATMSLPQNTDDDEDEDATIFHAVSQDQDLSAAILTITPENGEKYTLKIQSEKENFAIGRARKDGPSSADIAIEDNSISRLHCMLTWTFYGKLMINDLGSSNGTEMNSADVDGQEPVPEGATINIGRSVIEVSYEVD